MDYLNQDHPSLRYSETLRSYAVHQLLERGLRCSHSFRIQFDRLRLERVIGRESFSKLMPEFCSGIAPDAATYDIYEGPLNEDKIAILRRILSIASEGYPERPLNYIKSVRLLDQEYRTILRGGDHNAFILFDLPEPERTALVEVYRQHYIPENVIEQVDVDVERLEP
jgi:hypothetical protein